MDSQRAFEVETYGFTVLESVIDGAHARELADAVSVADARIGTDYVHQEAYARHVMNLALRRTLVLGGIGLGVGLFAAIWLSRLFQDLLYGVRPSDFPTFAGIAALLGAAALVACSIPARRATRVEPLKALRWE